MNASTNKPYLHIIHLEHPVAWGDWHDKPLRWQVSNTATGEYQQFITKKSAVSFAGFWRRCGNLTEAINASIRA